MPPVVLPTTVGMKQLVAVLAAFSLSVMPAQPAFAQSSDLYNQEFGHGQHVAETHCDFASSEGASLQAQFMNAPSITRDEDYIADEIRFGNKLIRCARPLSGSAKAYIFLYAVDHLSAAHNSPDEEIRNSSVAKRKALVREALAIKGLPKSLQEALEEVQDGLL